MNAIIAVLFAGLVTASAAAPAYNFAKNPLPEDMFVWSGKASEHRWAQAIDGYLKPGQQHVSIGAAQSFQQTRDGRVDFLDAWKIIADTWTPDAADPAASVTLQSEGGVLLAPAFLDGIGPMLFVFDPGAQDLYTSYARDRLNGRAPQTICLSTACFPARMQYFGADSQQLAPKYNAASGAIAGSIGPQLLQQYVASLDYGSSKLQLIAPAQFHAPHNSAKIPLKFDSYGLPVINATVDGIRATFELDVRAPTSMLFRPFLERTGLARVYARSPVAKRSGTRVGHAVHAVQVGGLQVHSVPFWFSSDLSGKFASGEVAGLLGNNLLSHFSIIFDYPHRGIYLIKP